MKVIFIIILSLLLSILGCSQSTNSEDSAGTTVAHWAFNEMEGLVLHDISDSNNDGQIINAEWVSGGLQFSDSSYVTVPYSNSLHPRSELTIEALFMMDYFYKNGSAAIVSTNASGGYGLWNYQGNLSLFIMINSVYYSANEIANFNINEPYHIAGTFDGESIKFFVNGILKDSIHAEGKITYDFNNALQIGRDASMDEEPGGDQFYGIISEIRISSKALEPDEFITIP